MGLLNFRSIAKPVSPALKILVDQVGEEKTAEILSALERGGYVIRQTVPTDTMMRRGLTALLSDETANMVTVGKIWRAMNDAGE